jgi:hypothetical protein
MSEVRPLRRNWPMDRPHFVVELGTRGGWAVHDQSFRDYTGNGFPHETAYFSTTEDLLTYLRDSLPTVEKALVSAPNVQARA